MPDGVLQDTLTVTVRGITYVFAIPSFMDEIKLGIQEREIRAIAERDLFGPEHQLTNMPGTPTGDFGTETLVRTAALFKVLLRQASDEWPYSKGPRGEPVIDFTKWPSDRVTDAADVGVEFSNALRSFREERVAARNGAGGQTVAGEPDTREDQPVRPDAPAS